MSTTPRTDAKRFDPVHHFDQGGSSYGQMKRVEDGDYVPVELARDLELENNDLREVLNKLTDSYFLHRCEGMLELMMRADRLRPLDMKGDK
jgi:hypothetical protein